MNDYINYSYNLNYNKENVQNQIILWKIDNYISYLTNFIISDDNNIISFSTALEDNIIFTYNVNEKKIQTENLTNEHLLNELNELNEINNADNNIYTILSLIEKLITDMPDEEDEDTNDEENNEDTNINLLTQRINESANKSSAEKNNEILEYFTNLELDIGSDNDSEHTSDNKTNPEIKCKSLVEVTESETDSSLNILYSDSIPNQEIDISDLTGIIIQENSLDSLDPLDSLNLSDSDFASFYENLNIQKENYVLNEKEIINTSEKILQNEPSIQDDQMKKYAFNNLSIIKMIIKEVNKTNSIEGIKIVPDNNNIFKLNVTIDKFSNGRLSEDFIKYKKLNPNFDMKLHLTIEMGKLYYPYIAPIITINEPKFDNIFLFSIESLEYFKQEYWNPSNTIEHILNGLIQLVEQYATIDFDNSNVNNDAIKLWSLLSLEIPQNNLKIDFIKLNSTHQCQVNSITKMASGTGYSNGESNTWDIKKFFSEKKNKSKEILYHLKQIADNISFDNLPSIELIQNNLASILYYYLYDVNILEITNKIEEYELIISILSYLQPYYSQISYKQKTLLELVNNLIATVRDYMFMVKNNDNEIGTLCVKIINLNVQNYCKQDKTIDKSSYDSLKEQQFDMCKFKNFSVVNNNSSNGINSKRILREFSSLKNSLPFNYETSIFFRYDENNMNKIKFLIIGPKDTPYQDGCYIFDMLLPSTYPLKNPSVNFLTTGKGSVRFNPNLYNCGKVCLSLLGTWQGESWNENSTILQVLVSIQSLILIEHPYFNEPGYQGSYGTKNGMEESKKYNQLVETNNIKWAIIDNILNPVPEFAEIIKNHYSIKKNDIIQLAQKWGKTNTQVLNQLPALIKALDLNKI
jgi:ubiquitin-protein ligase